MNPEDAPEPMPQPKPAPSPVPPGSFQESRGDNLPAKTGPLAGLSIDDLITLNEEIAGMARAGLPMDQGLSALAREMGRGRLQKVTAEIAVDLRGGLTLPEALERQAGRVPPFYAGLVAAGVRSGRISEVLATLTVYARSLADLRSTVISALFYPAVVMVLALILFGGLFFYIIPQFEQIFNEFDMKLPALTEWTFMILGAPLQFFGIPLLIIVSGVVLAKLCLSRQDWARAVYALPIAGTLVRAARLAAFTDLLAILVDHSLPLPEAFRLAGEASSDPLMADAARQVQQDLGQGAKLGEALRRRGLVPELVSWMIALSEQRGNLGKTLHQVAEVYRRQVELRAALLRSFLPPFLILGTAVVLVGLFLCSVSLPMLKLLEGLSM